MAMVDYGVVAIKNGKVINDGLFFMNMLTAVGWVDQKRIRHDDCDCFDDPDPLQAKSNCYFCNRAQKEKDRINDCDDASCGWSLTVMGSLSNLHLPTSMAITSPM